MRKIILIALVVIIGASTNQLLAQKTETKVVCFKSDMDCANCEKTITEHLKFEKGVKDLKVDHATNTILVEYKAGKNTEEGFANAIEKKGYKAEKITTEQYKEILEHAAKEGHEHKAEVHIKRN